ncbi:carboxylic ester hydrolase [Favolaschia claudopus]|uniref:Carboxylic ester hydrolase n=1 Tax=Favolaschia claudopus TaxID=2862362 RepID=A0AAW0BRN4_9AGAR
MGVSLAAGELLGPIFGSITYGIYLVTFGIAMHRLLTTADTGEWKRRSQIKWVMVAVSCVLFVNGTLNITVAIITIFHAFVVYRGPGGPEHVFTHSSSWQTLTKSFNVPFQSLLGDAILIYRCWYLWNRNIFIVALPLLIWFANVAVAIRFLILLGQAAQGLIISTSVRPWVQAFWVMTICINIMTTSLIVLRIWMVERQNKSLGISENRPRSTLGRAMRNIIESGAIYTAASIFTLVTEALESNLTYPASGIEIHSVGITFNLILIRAARNIQQSAHPTVSVGFTQPRTMTSRVDTNDIFAMSRIGKESNYNADRGPEAL